MKPESEQRNTLIGPLTRPKTVTEALGLALLLAVCLFIGAATFQIVALFLVLMAVVHYGVKLVKYLLRPLRHH